jgi:hypothetical protein
MRQICQKGLSYPTTSVRDDSHHRRSGSEQMTLALDSDPVITHSAVTTNFVVEVDPLMVIVVV